MGRSGRPRHLLPQGPPRVIALGTATGARRDGRMRCRAAATADAVWPAITGDRRRREPRTRPRTARRGGAHAAAEGERAGRRAPGGGRKSGAGACGAPVAWILDHGRYTCCCGCRPCSCAPCARTRRTPRCPSHRLLVRAGYIRRAAPGIYTWLPLGLARAAQRRAHRPRGDGRRSAPRRCTSRRCCPREPYEATGRWTEYGDNIFRLKDRKGNDYLLGPTHEEMFTLLVKDLYSSYKDLPLSIYQIQTKYRDEARPRAGLLRGREFVMKDSYSFDIDDAGLEASYDAHREAYIRIFDRLGLDYVIVSAMSGAMGGSQERGVPRAGRGRRGHLRPLHELRLRRQRRGRAAPRVPAARRTTSVARRARRGHARHPDHRDARRPSPTRASPASDRRLDGGRHAEERRRQARAPRRQPRAARRSACPATARSTPKRLEAQVEPGRGRAVQRGGLRDAPRAGQGLHRPRRAGREERLGHPLPPRPAGRRPAPAGSPAPTSPAGTSSTSSPGRDFNGDGTIEAAEVRDGDPCPTTAARASRPPAASRWATSSSSAASTPRRSASRCSTRTASWSPSRWAPTASASPAPSPPIAEAHATTSSACAGRGRSRPADVHLVGDRQGRRGLRRRPSGSPTSWRPPASRVLYDDRREGLARA